MAAAPARAAAPSSSDGAPAEAVRRTVDQVLDVLRDPVLQRADKHAQRVAKIRQIADRIFDWNEMAQRSLGAPWRRASDAERRRFVELFTDRIAEKYMDDLDRFRGDEKVIIEGAEPAEDNQRVATVLITHSRERVPIDYFLHETAGGWRIYDFSIEGVSLVNHYRSTLGRYLVNHSFDQLLQRLQRPAQRIDDRESP